LSGRDAALRREMMKKNSGFLVMALALVLVLAMSALMGACPGSSEDAEVPFVEKGPVTNEAGLTAAVNAINASPAGDYTIILTKDAAIETSHVYFNDTGVEKTITIRAEDGETCTITTNTVYELFTVQRNNTLVLENNVTLDGGGSEGGTPVLVEGGTLLMKDGSKITNSRGHGVYINGGTFTMEGGEISDNREYGVYVSSRNQLGRDTIVGAFTMTGGDILRNGGKILLPEENLVIGGGVWVAKESTFTKSGGTIAGINEAIEGYYVAKVSADHVKIRQTASGKNHVLIYNSKDGRPDEGWD
jgi:hypothetical protein